MPKLEPGTEGLALPFHSAETEEVGSALFQGLDLPLSALRASVESLSKEFELADSGRRIVNGVIGEVERLGRNVRDLLDYAQTPEPRPLRCTVGEIAHCAHRGFSQEDCERLLFARTPATDKIVVDGPLVSRCLRRLIENALEATGGEVLIRVRQSDGWTTFSVVDAGPGAFDPERAQSAFFTTKSDRLGLGLSLARRDLSAMGGELVLERSPLGGTTAAVRVPNTQGGQA